MRLLKPKLIQLDLIFVKQKFNSGGTSMSAAASFYLPQVFRNFQGFKVKDIKEWREAKRLEIILDKVEGKEHICAKCSTRLGRQDGRYLVKAKHMKIMSWSVEVHFFREKRFCPTCKKIRSEAIDFIYDTSPHVTKDLAYWINRLSEITTVLQVSRLESIDKQTCYKVDKHMLKRFLQGYKIPSVTKISVDEVYARGKKQMQAGETRDDLFLTVIVDIKTHKVVWVSGSRRKEALDEFFKLLGEEGCKQIEVVATDQHPGYGASVLEFCPNATLVWDRFHLVQKFNDALNLDRRDELEKLDPDEDSMGDLMNNKYRYLFTSRPHKRSELDKKHIEEVMRLNQKMAMMEIIKERFHSMFSCDTVEDAKAVMSEVYQWAFDARCINIFKWLTSIRTEKTFWNYWHYKVTTGISEGINRAIKGLKWQAYGYKDMFYFKLKILQKCGYLNSRFNMASV
jgi:transposase